MPMTQKEFNRRIAMLDKVIQIKKDFKELLPEIEQDKYIVMLSHVAYFCSNKKEYRARNGRKKTYKVKPLTEAEKIMLDYFLKNNLVPITVYRWFRASKVPQDIMQKLRKGQVTVKEAIKTATNRLKQKQSNTGLIMLEEINNVIASL
jgi:hypothetical protein